MEQNKEILIEIFKKLGEKCTSCGRFFIGAAVEASTESGNYGVCFEGINPISDFSQFLISKYIMLTFLLLMLKVHLR